MSVRMMAEVWRLRLDTPAKMVLLKLADHANDDGGNAYPSVERIAEETGMHKRSVQRSLARLRVLGLITIAHEATRYAPATYAIHPDRGDILPRYRDDNLSPMKPTPRVTPRASQGRRSAAPGVTSGRSMGGTPPPKPSLNHQGNHQKNHQEIPPYPPQAGGTAAERGANGSRRKRDQDAQREALREQIAQHTRNTDCYLIRSLNLRTGEPTGRLGGVLDCTELVAAGYSRGACPSCRGSPVARSGRQEQQARPG